MQLKPFPYHLAVADSLERLRPPHWEWFVREHAGARYQAVTSADLSQHATLAPDRDNERRAYSAAKAASDRLGLAAPVTLHRARAAAARAGARLAFMPDAIVIVIAGDFLEALSDDTELTAALGREIARFKLYSDLDGRLHAAESMLGWMLRRDDCPAEIIETATRLRIMTEAYCDIGGLVACEDRDALLHALFKTTSGANAAEAETYLRPDGPEQAAMQATSRTTDDDLARRAVALAGASLGSLDALCRELEGLVGGPAELGALDLIEQEHLRTLSRTLVDRMLSEPGCSTPPLLARARELFPGYTAPAGGSPVDIGDPISSLSPSVSDYLAFLLLDLAAAETGTRFRNTIAVAAAVADETGIGGRFREIARQELRGRRGLHAGLARRAA